MVFLLVASATCAAMKPNRCVLGDAASVGHLGGDWRIGRFFVLHNVVSFGLLVEARVGVDELVGEVLGGAAHVLDQVHVGHLLVIDGHNFLRGDFLTRRHNKLRALIH